jgi:hypothetical protein
VGASNTFRIFPDDLIIFNFVEFEFFHCKPSLFSFFLFFFNYFFVF